MLQNRNRFSGALRRDQQVRQSQLCRWSSARRFRSVGCAEEPLRVLRVPGLPQQSAGEESELRSAMLRAESGGHLLQAGGGLSGVTLLQQQQGPSELREGVPIQGLEQGQ